MTFPLLMLLGFAIWTVVLVMATIGMYRWSNILFGRKRINEFSIDKASPEGPDWYLRAMRAHANCVENLPVFAVIVLCVYASGVSSFYVNAMCAAVLVARIIHSILHVILPPTNINGHIKFFFYFVQVACFFGISAIVVSTVA